MGCVIRANNVLAKLNDYISYKFLLDDNIILEIASDKGLKEIIEG